MSPERVLFLHAGSTGEWPPLLLGLLPAVALAYLGGVGRARRRGKRWSTTRTAWFLAGLCVLGIALVPGRLPMVPAGFPEHAVQHAALGMVAPAAMVLGAPISLLLLAVPNPHARQLAVCLRCRAVRLFAHPVTAGVLSLGGMAVLYLTPLYALSLASPPVHALVHFHLLAAGSLYAWSIAGVDPVRHRPSFAVRLAVLAAVTGAHAALLKVMYAHGWPEGAGHGLSELRAGLELMYYGGDVASVLLAGALFAEWYRRRGRTSTPNPTRTTTTTEETAVAVKAARSAAAPSIAAYSPRGEREWS